MSWVAVGVTAVKVGSTILGNNAQKKAINKATETYTQGAQQAGNILSQGYEDAKIAKLDALAKIGALTPEQMDATIRAIDAGQTQYIDTMIATGEAYAGQMGDAGAAYRAALTDAGNNYGVDLNRLGAKYTSDVGQIGQKYGAAITRAGDDYGAGMDAIVTQYGGEITQLAQQLGIDIETAAQVFADALNQSADRFGGEILAGAQEEAAALEGAANEYGVARDKGLKAITSALSPYAEGRGTQALDYMSSLAGQDPSTLDPAQTRMRESYLRDSAARLAASGLRGAGRAGVAAVNEGDAELRARLYTENRDRATAAADNLMRTGYSASSQIGSAGERAAIDSGNVMLDARGRGISAVSGARNRGAEYGAQSRAQGLSAVSSARDRGAVARQTAGNQAAEAKRLSGENVAKTKLDLGTDVAATQRDFAKGAADTRLNLGKDASTTQLNLGKDAALNDQDTARRIAGVDLDIGKGIADQGLKGVSSRIAATDRGYDQARDVADKEGEAIADAALGKAGAQAGAVADPAWIAAQAALAKGNIKADTIGAVGSSVVDLITGGMKKAG